MYNIKIFNRSQSIPNDQKLLRFHPRGDWQLWQLLLRRRSNICGEDCEGRGVCCFAPVLPESSDRKLWKLSIMSTPDQDGLWIYPD